MTYASIGTMGVLPGKRDAVVAILSRRNNALAAIGCLAYEVGISEREPDMVFVTELWMSAQAHAESLRLPSVREAFAEATPLLTGVMDSHGFEVVGSPLRSTGRSR